MKFVADNLTKCLPRLGTLAEFNGQPKNLTLRTPLVILHTIGGQVPHITQEVLKLVTDTPQILQIPLVSVYNFKEALELYDGTINDFIGSEIGITCLTVQDPSCITRQGFHSKGKMPIWTKNGKMYYDSKTYMETVEIFQPNMYNLLSDGDTNSSSPKKRIAKAVENTNLFHKECMEIHRRSKNLKNSFVIAPVAGGYCTLQRKECLGSILRDDDDVGGYLIDGLHNNGPEVEFLPFGEVENIVKFTIDKLPVGKLRVIHGCWNPLAVIQFAKLGVDVFDTSYCRVVTERSAALTFSFDDDEETSFEINLRQLRYSDDFRPILEDCPCLACTKYNRGYIHHLIAVQELTGPILIMIHNIHHYLRFFEHIRYCIEKNTLNELEFAIERSFQKYQRKLMSPQNEPVVGDPVPAL